MHGLAGLYGYRGKFKFVKRPPAFSPHTHTHTHTFLIAFDLLYLTYPTLARDSDWRGDFDTDCETCW
jgi:hypothetical protein